VTLDFVERTQVNASGMRFAGPSRAQPAPQVGRYALGAFRKNLVDMLRGLPNDFPSCRHQPKREPNSSVEFEREPGFDCLIGGDAVENSISVVYKV